MRTGYTRTAAVVRLASMPSIILAYHAQYVGCLVGGSRRLEQRRRQAVVCLGPFGTENHGLGGR